MLGHRTFREYTAYMRRIAAILVFASCCSLAFAQLDSNSITVSASNNVTLQPDQAIFSVSVTSGLTTGFDDVLAALQGSGITAANLSGVTTQNDFAVLSGGPGGQIPPPMLTWSFTLTSPLTNTKSTVASLTTLQQNIAKANNGLTLSFSIVGTQVSQQLAQSQTCSIPSLLDFRHHAGAGPGSGRWRYFGYDSRHVEFHVERGLHRELQRVGSHRYLQRVQLSSPLRDHREVQCDAELVPCVSSRFQ